MVDLRTGNQDMDDPAQGKAWEVDRAVRAELLAELLTGARKPKKGSLRAVRVSGARITGPLNLDSAALCCPLFLQDCYVEERISMVRTEAPAVNLLRCHVPEIDARGLQTSGDVAFSHVFCLSVLLLGARIRGQLHLGGATLRNPQGTALAADELIVEQSMLCRDGFSVKGEMSLNAARIGGHLDLRGAMLRNVRAHALEAVHLSVGLDMSCEGLSATGQVLLNYARIGGNLDFTGADLSNRNGQVLSAIQITVGQSIGCSRGFSATGQVVLLGARIGGQLDLCGAKLTNPEGNVLEASMLKAEQGIVFADGFSAEGEIVVSGARVGGQFRIDEAHLANPGGCALIGDRLSVEGSMLFGPGFSAEGEVKLLGAEVGGGLELHGVRLSNPGGRAFHADGLHVKGDVLFGEGDGFSAEGEVRLPHAHIGGWLCLREARLSNPKGWALYADVLTVEQNVLFGEGFSAEGEVRLGGAHIGAQLGFIGARLDNRGGHALVAERLTVGKDLFFRDGSCATGEIRMAGVHIGGQLDFSGARLDNAGSRALWAAGAVVDDRMACCDGFTSLGEVSLCAVRIGGQLDLSGACLENPEGNALDLAGASMDELVFLPRERPKGVVDLTNARASTFQDDSVSWPDVLLLQGFIYEKLANTTTSARTRLDWLDQHQSSYLPEIYDQLGAAYRNAGLVEAARQAAIAKERRHSRELRLHKRMWSWVNYLSVGYGHRKWRAALWIIGLLAVGSNLFALAYPAHMHRTGNGDGPAFSPVVYTLDVLLPFLGLGQANTWTPQGWALVAFWLLKGVGWPLAAAVVAGLTSALARGY